MVSPNGRRCNRNSSPQSEPSYVIAIIFCFRSPFLIRVIDTGWVRTFELVDHAGHVTHDGFFQSNRTFIGIAVHKAAATGSEKQLIDLAAGVRQDATGLLGTTAQLADLVSSLAPLVKFYR